MVMEEAPSEHANTSRELHSNWGAHLVRNLLYPFAIFAAPAFLLVLMLYFVITAFIDGGLAQGIQSAAAVLLPLMVVTFLISYRRDAVQAAGEGTAAPLAFLGAFVAGGVVMLTMEWQSSIPVGELVASSAFSVLVGSYVVLERERYISYYFGFVLGILTFVTVMGIQL
jgi:hypothetical protein